MIKKVRHFLSLVRFFFSYIGRLGTLKKYASSNFNSPPPDYVKQSYLSKQQSLVWIETGTFKGKTTEILATTSSHVTTIEAQEFFYSANAKKFSKIENITALCGESDKLIAVAIQNYINSDSLSINFFLDAHYSGGETHGFNHRSPVLGELEVIERFLPKLRDVSVFIDDFRLFQDKESAAENYPTRNYLVEFAQKNGLFWDVSHDMFVLSKSPILKQ
jgi:hypothetical protein